MSCRVVWFELSSGFLSHSVRCVLLSFLWCLLSPSQVLAVGYETVDGQIYTKVKNSWSNHWGDEGFILVSQKDNCCGVATQPTYTIL